MFELLDLCIDHIEVRLEILRSDHIHGLVLEIPEERKQILEGFQIDFRSFDSLVHFPAFLII